jgi:hypothetical protein
VQKGAWLQLGGFALSLWIGALLVMRDVDGKPRSTAEKPPTTDDDPAGPDPDDADSTNDPASPAQSKLRRSRMRVHPRRWMPARDRLVAKMVRRTLTVAVTSLGLLIPTTQAAFSVTTKNNTNTWSVPNYNYTTETNNLGPFLYWKLDDAAASATAIDSSGNARTGTYNSTWTKGVVGALVDQATNLAVTPTNATAPNASVSCVYSPASAGIAQTGPTVYTEIVWFKTVSTTGGKLIGYENTRTGVSNSSVGGGQYDRMMYMDGAGKIWFAVWRSTAGGALAISSAAAVNDGAWHMAAATMSSTTGMALYIDGVQVATNANTMSETESATGYFRVGCGNLAGWGAAATWTGPNAPVNTLAANVNYPFNGSLDEATVYTSTLTASQIAFLYWIR